MRAYGHRAKSPRPVALPDALAALMMMDSGAPKAVREFGSVTGRRSGIPGADGTNDLPQDCSLPGLPHAALRQQRCEEIGIDILWRVHVPGDRPCPHQR